MARKLASIQKIATVEPIEGADRIEKVITNEFLTKDEEYPMSTDNDYISLEKQDDWGAYYYAEKGKGLSKHGTASQKLGLPLAAGQHLRVQFPDGEECTVLVEEKPYTSRVSDHGHDYTVKTAFYGFRVTHHGITQWVDLVNVKVHRDDLPRESSAQPSYPTGAGFGGDLGASGDVVVFKNS
jgi:hypothetical protein